MIGFFTRIRRKLANENEFLKYSRYAIGEIVLVMVGILLALQVNNWNEKRIAKNEEQVLLKILLSDFENRLTELELLNRGRVEAAGAIEELLNYAENPQLEYQAETIDSLLAMATLTYRFNEKFSTLDMLFNSGKINTLSNEPLKVLLVNWPALVEEMLEEQRLIVKNFHEMEAIMRKYVSLRDVYQQFSWNNVVMPEIGPSQMKKEYEDLLNDKQFRNVIASKRFLLYINIADTEHIITDAKSIIELLNGMIKSEQ